ncbi:MAG: hypothetical protein K2Q34_00725 [Alphaproteobacteria bacterium]|nr:hypothetical protein [Alphaproteobacteria bacterium]
MGDGNAKSRDDAEVFPHESTFRRTVTMSLESQIQSVRTHYNRDGGETCIVIGVKVAHDEWKFYCQINNADGATERVEELGHYGVITR